MKRFALLTPVVLTIALAACENRNTAPLGQDFGNAVHHNMSLHIINPEPVTAGYGAPALDGTRATGIIKRYETGNVTQPSGESTSDNK